VTLFTGKKDFLTMKPMKMTIMKYAGMQEYRNSRYAGMQVYMNARTKNFLL
jgi:hypothetical protein